MSDISFEKYNIVVVTPEDLDFCEKLLSREGWNWSFLGVNPILRENLINQFGSSSRYCYSEEFQQIYIELKKDFLDWISEIGKNQSNSIWWATNIAYKSPFASDLFLNFCYLYLIKKWIGQGVKKRI